jgi:hypothetical protein
MRLTTVTYRAAIPAARISRSDRENALLIDSKSVRGDIGSASMSGAGFFWMAPRRGAVRRFRLCGLDSVAKSSDDFPVWPLQDA